MASKIKTPWYLERVKDSLICKVDIDEIEQWFIQEGWLGENSSKFSNHWDQFKSEMLDNDEIWSYRFGGPLSMRMGYSIVRNNEIINCFQTGMS